MEIISYALLLAMLFLIVFGYGCSVPVHGKGPALMSVNAIIMSSFLLYILFSAALPILIDDFSFTWAISYGGAEQCAKALIVCFLAILSYIVTYRGISCRAMIRFDYIELRSIFVSNDENLVRFLSYIYVFGIAAKVYGVMYIGGIDSAMAQMSAGLRESLALDTRDGFAGMIRSFSTCADYSITALLIRYIMGKRKNLFLLTFYLALFCLTMFLTYIASGKRTFVAQYILAIIVALVYRVKFVSLRWVYVLIFGSLLFGWFTLWFRSVYVAGLHGIYIGPENAPWSHGSYLGMYFFNQEFAFFETIVLSMQASDTIISMFGGALDAFYVTNIEPLGYLIPRAIWSSKPDSYYDMSYAVSSIMFGSNLGDEASGMASSYIGTMWIIFGIFGVVIYSSILAFFAAIFDVWYVREGIFLDYLGVMLYALIVFSAFIFWRQGGIGFAIISIGISQIGLIAGLIISWNIGVGKIKLN